MPRGVKGVRKAGQTRERLEALHQRRTEAFPADVMNARIDDPYQTSEASVLKCIQSWGSRISSGPSLLTRDHMKQLVNDASSVCLPPLTNLVNLMLAGTIDAAAADWISAGCLSALGKPGPTGAPKRDEEGRLQCRPIAAPETLYALAAKAATIEALPDVKAALAKEKQLGVKVSSACEAIIASIEVVMEDGDEDANDERVCLALQSDASSAFQTVSRAAVLKAVHKYAPRLVPFVRLFYGKDSRLVWGRRGPGNTSCVIIVSSDGVRQGCPPAMLCFYLDALKATQVAHPDVFIPSCADDTTVIGEPAAAAAAFVTLRTNMKAIGIWARTCPSATVFPRRRWHPRSPCPRAPPCPTTAWSPSAPPTAPLSTWTNTSLTS